MPFMPSMPTDALVKDVYSINPQRFRHWLHVEEAIMRGPLLPPPDSLSGMGTSRTTTPTPGSSDIQVMAGCVPDLPRLAMRLPSKVLGTLYVCSARRSGQQYCTAVMRAFDPNRSSPGQFCCDAQQRPHQQCGRVRSSV
jgi:hypothetical protein